MLDDSAINILHLKNTGNARKSRTSLAHSLPLQGKILDTQEKSENLNAAANDELPSHILKIWLPDNRQRYASLPQKISNRVMERLISVYAQLRPIEADDPFPMDPERKQRLVELIWSQLADLSDLDADLLDLLSAIWLQQARTPNDPATVTVDECLRLRGLTPKLGGAGRRGGHTAKQRGEFLYFPGRMESTWLKMSETSPQVDSMVAKISASLQHAIPWRRGLKAGFR